MTIRTFSSLTRLSLFIIVAIVGITSPSHADEGQIKALSDILADNALAEGEFRYAPETCDFEITFPEAPLSARRCSSETKECTPLMSYTMVYDVRTTIEIMVSCIKSTPKKYEDFSEKVISTALNGMVSRADISEQQINTIQKEDYRVGSLLGEMKRGKQNSIYNAQILVGQNSVMTVESKLIGPSHEVADEAFSKIISTIKRKPVDEDTPKPEADKN